MFFGHVCVGGPWGCVDIEMPLLVKLSSSRLAVVTYSIPTGSSKSCLLQLLVGGYNTRQWPLDSIDIESVGVYKQSKNFKYCCVHRSGPDANAVDMQLRIVEREDQVELDAPSFTTSLKLLLGWEKVCTFAVLGARVNGEGTVYLSKRIWSQHDLPTLFELAHEIRTFLSPENRRLLEAAQNIQGDSHISFPVLYGKPQAQNEVEIFNGECCAICLETYTESSVSHILPCGHAFHVDCADQWLRTSERCPLCKKRVYSSARTRAQNRSTR